MTAADGIPVALGLAGGVAVGCWALAEKLREISHDKAMKRLESEEENHDVTRKDLADAKRHIIDLEARLPPESHGKQ